ncbi:replication initiation factor domain-containing protein [Acinetobacter baumannii]|nr:replication initiation factor domain-containing protein [Acinetobacter baumannii]
MIDKAAELLSQIQNYEHKVFNAADVKKVSDLIFSEIQSSAFFAEIKIDVADELNKLLKFSLNKKLSLIADFEDRAQKRELLKQNAELSASDIFEQKVIKECSNTYESPCDLPPIYNMREKGTDSCAAFEFPRYLDNYKIISTPKGILPVAVAVPTKNEAVGVDWVTFSFAPTSLSSKVKSIIVEPAFEEDYYDDLIKFYLEPMLYEIFGFGLGEKRKSGMHHCKYSWNLADDMGLVLYGHNSSKIFIQLNGTGCSLSRKGWQQRLFDFLTIAHDSKLSRVDLAFDDFEGQYLDLDIANKWDSEGLFCTNGRTPDSFHLGCWKRPNGKGRTLNIGDRNSSKSMRFYERGKKFGDKTSPWVRAEVEMKADDRYLPFDMLISPTKYFIGAYPALRLLIENLGEFAQPEKIEIIKKQSVIEWDKAVDVVKNQFGKYIKQFRKVYDDSVLLDMISSEKDDVPKRLKFSMTAAMRLVENNENIFPPDQELPLFEGVQLLNQSAYYDFVNATI